MWRTAERDVIPDVAAYVSRNSMSLVGEADGDLHTVMLLRYDSGSNRLLSHVPTASVAAARRQSGWRCGSPVFNAVLLRGYPKTCVL